MTRAQVSRPATTEAIYGTPGKPQWRDEPQSQPPEPPPPPRPKPLPAKVRCVDSLSDGAFIDEAVRVPSVLKCEDGRELHVTKWAPVVSIGDFVRATVEVLVKVPITDE